MAFGADPFGVGRFGEGDWSGRAIWGNVPTLHQGLDTSNLLRGLLSVFEDELDGLKTRIRELPKQRDPLFVRANEESESVTATTSAAETNSYFGECSRLTLQPTDQVTKIGPDWTGTIGSAQYKVLSVNTRDVPNTILIDSKTAPTVSATLVKFTAPSVLQRLSRDFGIETDLNEPDSFQRSLVANATKYFGIKGSPTSFNARGDVSGLSVQVLSLYRLRSSLFQNVLSADAIFVSGTDYYTPTVPQAVLYDDIPADGTITDDVYMYEDLSADDGISAALAYAQNVTTLTVTGSAPLSAAELAANGLAQGHAVTAQISNENYAMFNVGAGAVSSPAYGVFAIVSDMAPVGVSFTLEKETAYVGTTVRYIVGTSVAPHAGVYHVTYTPPVTDSCDWCKSHRLWIRVTPTAEAITFYGSGAAINRAIDRLIERLQILIPVHAEVIGHSLSTTTAVTSDVPTVSDVIVIT